MLFRSGVVVGTPFSDDDAVAMAEDCGFEPRHRIGAETQYFWLWYFRRTWWSGAWNSLRKKLRTPHGRAQTPDRPGRP